ncbi:nitroreductase family protein [Anaerobacillus sp. HL2]|nr:nitroreductase family protein [Anaerobacillus sp. HL2]
MSTDPISDEVLDQILEAGTWAPSHRNNQPWEFIIIKSQNSSKATKSI